MTKNSISKEVDNAPDWEARVDIVCERLRIPELRSRSGLKKIHKRFPEVYQQLNACYRANLKNPSVLGAVVAIYAKMCVDVLLRERLFREGFFSQIMPLLDVPSCRVLALKCLVIITHHEGRETRYAIAKYMRKLVKLVEDNINDPIITEECIMVISHIAVAAPDDEDKNFDMNLLFKSLGSLELLLELTEKLLRSPTTRYMTFSHAVLLFSGAPHYGRKDFIAHQSSISFLVACLRSTDLKTRVSGMLGIMRLHHSVGEQEDWSTDAYKMIANLHQGPPPIMAYALLRYGVERTVIATHLTSTKDFQAAMAQCAQDHDLYSLGMKMFELICRTEYSVTDGLFQDEHGQTVDVGLPFVRWVDALPLCAKAIRERGAPAQRDAANIVELKYYMFKARVDDYHRLAQEGLKNSPGVAFYYYALALGAVFKEGLRWAKKGLKCVGPSLTPYLRFGLMFSAIEYAGLLGLQVLEGARNGEKAWEEGFAILRCAFEDSKTYVAEAPPDSRYMSTVILWRTILTFVISGPDVSAEMGEIKPLLEKQKVADVIKTFLHSIPTAKTQLRLSRDTILERYTSATAEWGPTISKFDAEISGPPSQALVLSRTADEELSAWLEGTNIDDEDAELEKLYCVHSIFSEKTLDLWQCSWCSNPSAILKKCARCGRGRYCDASCQKMHWPEHKKICKTI